MALAENKIHNNRYISNSNIILICCLCRYIFGLPLWQKNAVELSKEIMALAEKNLAPGAVIGYELGNEVRPLALCYLMLCYATLLRLHVSVSIQ
jgi:hypothetical protein